MTALPKEEMQTMADIYALPDGQRGELIGGKIYLMAPPKRIHQRLVGELYRAIGNHIAEKKLPCEANIAPFGVWLFADDTTYVEPDISVVCDQNKLNEDGCKGAPDFIIEIISPRTKAYDHVKKLNLYLDAGVKEYWTVDPYERYVGKHILQPEYWYRHYSFDEDVPVSLCEGFAVNLGKMGF